MPIYAYNCEKCGEIEVWHMPGEAKDTCPFCNGKITRAWKPVGIKFEGSGFYSNDNKKES